MLEERLTRLEAETPQYFFRTKDSYAMIIKNTSRSEIGTELFHGHVFGFPIPGNVETIEYDGLRVRNPGSSINDRCYEEKWDGFGTLKVDCFSDPNYKGGLWRINMIGGKLCTGEWTYGFFLDGTNYRFTLIRRNDYTEEDMQALDERMALCERITATFDRLNTFKTATKPKSRFVKPFYSYL